MSELISSLKEFIWDIIGYLIPGFFLIIIFNFVVHPAIPIPKDFLFSWEIFESYLYLIIAYILGFVVYSLTIFKIRNQNYIITKLEKCCFFRNKKAFYYFQKYAKSKHSKNWEVNFETSATVHSAREFLKEKGYKKVDEMKLNELRNILMSRNPEMDEKVYTFMFRSSVFDHTSTILLLFVIISTFQYLLILFSFELYILRTGGFFNFLYILFALLIPLLGNSKRIFYSISQRVPFSNLN